MCSNTQPVHDGCVCSNTQPVHGRNSRQCEAGHGFGRCVSEIYTTTIHKVKGHGSGQHQQRTQLVLSIFSLLFIITDVMIIFVFFLCFYTLFRLLTECRSLNRKWVFMHRCQLLRQMLLWVYVTDGRTDYSVADLQVKYTHMYRVAQKIDTIFLCIHSLPIFKLFHCQEKICSNTIAKDPTTHQLSHPQVCRYTTLWNVSVLNATIGNDDFCNNTFKEINNRKQRVYCLSYCLK